MSHYLLWVLVVVAAPCESPSAEEAEGQEEGGEEADHPEYRQGRCNINIVQIIGGLVTSLMIFGQCLWPFGLHSTGTVNRF